MATQQHISLPGILNAALQRNPTASLQTLERCILKLMHELAEHNTLAVVRQTLKMQLCIELTEEELLDLGEYLSLHQPRLAKAKSAPYKEIRFRPLPNQAARPFPQLRQTTLPAPLSSTPYHSAC